MSDIMYKLEISREHWTEYAESQIVYMEMGEDVDTLRAMAKAFFEDEANISAIRMVFRPDCMTIKISQLNDTMGVWDMIFYSTEFL